MRTKRYFVVFLITLIALFCEMQTRGQENSGNPLPDSLPIGGENKLLKHAVVNRLLYPIVNFDVVGDASKPSHYDAAPYVYLTFTSYEEFREVMTTQAWKLFTNQILPRADITSVRFSWSLHDQSDLAYWVTTLKGDVLGKPSEVRRDMLMKVLPQHMSVPITPTNLTHIKIELSCHNTHTIEWSETDGYKNFAVADGHGYQIVKNGALYARQWYSTNSIHVRITLTIGDKTARYTQDGARLDSAILRMNQSGLAITVPRGANAQLQYKRDWNSSWTLLDEISWDAHADFWHVPIIFSDPKVFYRIKTE